MSVDDRALELQFLPAALEIEETPPLPLARVMLWLICAFFTIAVGWAYWGMVDIVGIAPGKIVPYGRTKTIQSLEKGVVVAIRVSEGQHVEAGEVLVELDPTAPAADSARYRQERKDLLVEQARLRALLGISKATTGESASPKNDQASATATTSAQDVLEALTPTELGQFDTKLTTQRHEYRSALNALRQDHRQKSAEREAVKARIAELESALPLVTEEAEAHKKLTTTGIVPRVKWLAVERERIGVQQALAAQLEQRRVLDASLDSLAERLNVTEAQYKGRWMTELTEVETKLAAYDEEIAKAERRLSLTSLTAPIAGTVQQLAVHTVGGVVTEAQPLMMLVPDDAPIEVEAMVSNKDIGFVHEGQEVIVKVETFNFTRYGYVTGTVREVSRDATVDKDHGLVYTAHMSLASDKMTVDEREERLSPGMAVMAEVKMGRRRIVEFLLSPLIKYRQTSGRER